jgi:putative Ca2+/H+ antiporter (TMEM165/GDT1 family)
MDPRLFARIFGTIFLAELGDKTQLATLLYASDSDASRWTVFAAAAAALVLTSAIGVTAGGVVSHWVSPQTLSRVAGLGFIAIGVWTLFGSK